MTNGLVDTLIGQSAALEQVRQQAELAARSDAKVLIIGESGVGKEIVAGLIHRRSNRASAPLVSMNCAGLPDGLLESELFGHVRGSFTGAYRDKMGLFEQASGGTVFMDEVGEMSLRMQGVLLRFLENGETRRVGAEQSRTRVDVRIIAATNRNLHHATEMKTFREDLYYRLNVIQIEVPPLRTRRADIAPLFRHFLASYALSLGGAPPEIDDDVIRRLEDCHWPGNVRELKNIAERLIVARTGPRLSASDLPREVLNGNRSAHTVPTALRPVADHLIDRLMKHGESFWTVVYEPFVEHDLTREDLRCVIRAGLGEARGNYKILMTLFNMPPHDYKRFLTFLRKHSCHMPFKPFRSPANRSPSAERFN